jgi:glycosyltransferase involved in cell wall biosynthesis
MVKKVAVLVSNDLVHDQRVRKTCETLMDMNWEIELIGRVLPESAAVERPYKTHRLKLLFRTGVLFYFALQVRLFFYLLTRKYNVILANDLDTLLPAVLIGKLKNTPIVYDSHELFTEAEGLTGHPFKKKVWEKLEAFLFPRVNYAYTVNESIANIFTTKYHVPVGVVRNVPQRKEEIQGMTKEEMGLHGHPFVFILQGNYLDPDRGGLEAVEAMMHLDDAHLFVIGSGREFSAIREKAENGKGNVTVLHKMPYPELMRYTAGADCGLSLDKPLHLNYTFSLPNKLFDYIHAGIPVLVSPLPELKKIVETYKVGVVAKEVTPKAIAEAMREVMMSIEKMNWKNNCLKAREELTWENESKTIQSIFTEVIQGASKPI